MATIRKKYPKGTSVTITATPKQRKRFDHWYSQVGTPFNGGTSPMTSENPVQITLDRKYRIQAFFETIPNTSTSSTTGSLTRDNNVNFDRMESSEDFVNFFRFYEPFPGYDIRTQDSKETYGIREYYYMGNTERGTTVEMLAQGIAFTPYLRKAVKGYRLESQFFSNDSNINNNIRVGLISNEEPLPNIETNTGEQVTKLNGDLMKGSFNEEWKLDRQQIKLIVKTINGRTLKEFVEALPDKTYIGRLTVSLYYASGSAYNTLKHSVRIALVSDERQNPPIEEYNNEGAEIVINLKHLWNKYDGFYLHGNLEAEPNSANYNN